MSSQLALPGLAPICPHCGGKRTELLAPERDEAGDVVSGQHWRCRSCGREFWSLPSMNTGSRRP